MQLNDLRPAEGSRKARKRIGRGNSSGHGTTAGRGSKGQLSRAGGGKGAGFEGGQTVLAMRLPKLPGFKNRLVPMTAVPGVAVPTVGVSPDVHAANVNSMANTR